MTTSIIKTPRLRLEPFAESYLTARYVGWLNDAEVVRYSEQRHRRHTVESCREYISMLAASDDHFWAIVHPGSSFGHIGNIAAYVDLENRVADVTILIGEAAVWGKGLGAEAWCAVCDYMLGLGMRKVTGGTMSANEAMVRIMERAGMVPDGRRADHYLLAGQTVDLVHFAKFADRV